ncbi:MAG TPA: GspH/FimT family pseudopilin [Phycisphaerae bacterium]|jgi:type II secretion system protein H|nr:GspH/FimT family pseudopilin [Phycisphaerae bacterium]
MTHARNNLQSGRGFTLLELVVVMFVMALVAAIAAPNLKGFISGRRAPDFASQVMALAHYAHSQAISQGRMYQLNIDARTGEVTVTAEDDAGAQQPLQTSLANTLVIPQGSGGIRIESDLPVADGGAQAARFYPTGRCDPGTIKLTDERGISYTITCESPSDSYHLVEDK